MKRMNWQKWIGLAVGALLPVLSANAKDGVARPFHIKAHSQQVVSPDGDYLATAEGLAAHFGLVTMEGWGNITQPIGYGTITATNGDSVQFEFKHDGSGLVTITGGTGRFAGARGEFALVAQIVSIDFDPDAGTMTIRYIWTGAGTITY